MISGSVHLVLGTIAAARGRTQPAIKHLHAAVAANTASGLAPYAALARIELAQQLRRRDGPGAAADADAADAAAELGRLGMPLPPRSASNDSAPRLPDPHG
jgi:hypothetical protein